MHNIITKDEIRTLNLTFRGIESYLNFVDEAEGRTDGIVSVPEDALKLFAARIDGVLCNIEQRRMDHLENVPEHYRGDGYITCDMALAAMLARATRMAMPPMVIFWWANAFKYLWRWAYKGDCKGDLNKAIDCIERVRDWQKTR